jgi:replicative DNA helicase
MTAHRAVIDKLLIDLQHGRSNPDPVYGSPTGIRSVDLRTGGLHNGELTVVAARPGHGKTAWAGQVTYDIARYAVERDLPGHVLYFSAEMPAVRIAQREVARMTGISVPRQRAGEYTDSQWEQVQAACSEIKDLPVALYDQADCSVDKIRALADDHYRGEGVRLLVVDHLGLVVRAGSSAYQATSDAIHELRKLRDFVEAPLVVLCQLRRPQAGEEGDLPEPTHLRNSGEIEEAANNIYLLHNPPALQDGEEAAPRMAQLIVAKARDGWTGNITLTFNPERVSFSDRDAAPVALALPGDAA